MKEKDIIKTVFRFFVIDMIIFAMLAGIIAFFIGLLIAGAFPEVDFTLVQLLQLIILLILMYWNYKHRYQGKFNEEDAIKVIELRYANGDISKKQFEQMKKDLEDTKKK